MKKPKSVKMDDRFVIKAKTECCVWGKGGTGVVVFTKDEVEKEIALKEVTINEIIKEIENEKNITIPKFVVNNLC